MSILESLVQITNSRWISVKLYHQIPEGLPRLTGSVRLCEAVHMAYQREFYLTANNITCEGAKYCLGWKHNGTVSLVTKLSKKTGIDLNIINKMVKKVPTFENGFQAIALGHDVEGDVFISYCTPEGAMNLFRQWQMSTGCTDNMPLSSIMAVCGNGIVRAYTHQKICLSFGCPDSRKHGKIYPHQIVLTVPVRIATTLHKQMMAQNRD